MINTGKIEKTNIEDILPLTPMQESMLFQYLNNPGTEQYFEQLSLKLEGRVDSQAFRKAWEFIADRNEMLRTVYRWDKLEQPIQIVLKKHEIPVREYDFTNIESEKKQQRLNEVLENDRKERADISAAPFRVTLCRMEDDSCEMIISNHHILYDGWSNAVLLNEFIEAYNSFSEGKNPVMPGKNKFKEYVKWQSEQDKNSQKLYWQEYLSGFDAKTQLPYNRKPKQDVFNSGEFTYAFPDELANKVYTCAKKYNVTTATMFYAAWGLLLQKYCNSSDVTFGTTVSGRTHRLKGMNDVVGLFINTLPLRVCSESKDSVKAVLEYVNNALNTREDYECSSLADIKLWSGRDSAEGLFDSVVVVENYPLSRRQDINNDKLNIAGYSIYERTNFDLTLAIMAFSGIEIKLIYNADVFYKATIEELCRHFSQILEEMAASEEVRISDIDILSEAERETLLAENNTRTEFPKGKTLKELFEEQAGRVPEKTALVFENEELTYGGLNRKANQLAVFLRERGIKPGSVVGLVMERSFEMIISILAVLKAGGAYLPFDQEFPGERCLSIAKDANVSLMLVHNSLKGKLEAAEDFGRGAGFGIHIIEEVMANVAAYPAENIESIGNSEDVAYVMYTSGSTGIPKGILTTNYNISRVVKNTNYIEISDSDVLLQLSNYAFDGSTFDIFGALLNGAKLILARRQSLLDVYKLSELIKKEKVSVFFVTTALFNTLVELEVECLANIRKVLFGGERVSVKHVRKALEAVGRDKIIHVYGPTETTVFATYYPINDIDEELGTIPIGKPISNTEIYILDSNMKLLPKGAPGELYIGGDGLAKGYLNRPELSAEKFLSNPFVQGGNIYKTGDLVKMLPDGNIEFLDRIDSQVKLRGFRIELGEIEARLLSLEGVKEAIVAAREDVSGNKYLCAYIVAEREIKASEIKKHLSKELPDYMIPSRVVFLDAMPVNTNGKVDKKALLNYEDAVTVKAEYEAPTNSMETELLSVWKEVLGVETIGINDSFFELGGHSLRATVLASKIHKKMNVEVPLTEILRNPTIKELAEYMAGAARSTIVPIVPVPEGEYYEVSPAQKRMYVQQHTEGIGASYNMPVALMLEGNLDKNRLENSLKSLVDRHEALRTSFHMVEGQIVQKVLKTVEFKVEFAEISESSLDEFIKDGIKPFDLSTAPLLRVKLAKLSEMKHVLVIDTHHIISDGISLVTFIKELSALYDGEKPEELKIHYKDFSEWQKGFADTDSFKKQENYWMEALSGEIPLLNMPLDYRRPEKRSFRGESFRFGISKELVDGLNRLSAEKGVTLNALLISAYSIMLSKYSGQKDIMVGSLVAGRVHPDTENMMGMFNNFIPLKIRIDESGTFNDFLKATNHVILKAYENQEYPFDKLVENLAPNMVSSRNPLFDTMLILHNQLESIDSITFGEVSLKNYEFPHHTSKLDFKMDIYGSNSSGELKCILEYNVDLFRSETIEGMAKHFENIIKEVINKPDAAVDEIEMLSEAEKKRILCCYNNTGADYPKDRTVFQLFEEQVERTPDSTAVIFEDKELTYAELNARANRLARTLREMGVNRDSVVGIMTERSLEMSVGIMATLKAGGAYLPISPDYPEDRIKFMLEDSGATVLLVKNADTGTAAENEGWKKMITNGELTAGDRTVAVIGLDDERAYSKDGSNLEYVNSTTDLAYIIYTSGSTGKPKGAMIEHYSLVNRLNWMQKMYPIGKEDTILQKTPYTFDVSVWELFWWSFTGAKVCFLKPGGEKEPRTIVEAIEKNRITTMHFVPSMLSTFLGYVENSGEAGRISTLKQVFASGEALNLQQVSKFNKLLNKVNGTKLHNLYGPTEATVDVSYFDCSSGKELEIVPIGRPIDNINLYILDSKNRLQPVGVPGELHIAGDGLARGYLNRPELTAEKFVANPFKAGERMYKTGDLARWLPDGNIEYLGRIDTQVKVRGFRIELGEIEAELLKHEEVMEAVVAVRDDKEGGKYLCAYYVSEKDLSVADLRAHLSVSLPDYMIPSYFMRLDKIPLSGNGKADRKALPEPDGEINTGRAFEAASNEIEEKLVEIWKEILGADRISVNDDFFELGGHSLKAANLAVKIHKEFNANLTLSEIFKASTVRNLAVCISEAKEDVFTAIEKIEMKEYHPVSSSQKRLFIINQLEGNNTTYNLPSMSIIEGEIDMERFRSVLDKLVKRHESLRTSFKLIGEDPVQIVHDEVDVDIEYSESDEENLREIAGKFIRPFDLGSAPLIRVALVKIGENRHLLMFDMHHIIADGVSSVILVKEFAESYSGAELSDLKIQFKDYAAWQNELNESEEIEKQKAYWMDTFKGTIPVLNLPTDFTRPSVQNNEGDKLTFRLDNTLVANLRTVAAENGATLYMVLLAAYNTLLYRYTGQEDIVIGTPSAGRQHADVENVIGMFVNTLALRNYPEGEKTFRGFLDEVRNNALMAYENQDYQFEKLVDNLDIPRDISRNPMFDTMFVLQNMGIPNMEFGGLKFLPFGFENKVSKFDLTFEVVENGDDVVINIEYCTRLFKRETIERMAGHFRSITGEAAKNPDVKLAEMEMLSEDEKSLIICGFNNTEAEYPKNTTIYQLFESQAAKAPNNTAVIFEGMKLTYGELNAKANQLAGTLRRNGVRNDSIVGIMVERSLEMGIGIMAILKAGGAYLPISPDYPEDRIKFMLEDSGANILLVQNNADNSQPSEENWKSSLKNGEAVLENGKKVTVLNLNDEQLYAGDGNNPEMINKPNDLAYIIYTSGSTGKPKGAMIEHYSLVNRLNWMQKMYAIGEGDVILQKTPYTFDVSVWELFWWGMTGAAVCFLKPGGEKDPGAIVEAIEKNGVTTMHFVPSMLTAFMEYVEANKNTDRLRSLRQVFASGEALSAKQVSKFNSLLFKANGTKLHNLYGPTEATVDVSYFDCSTGEELDIIPIGKPIDNINLFVVDRRFNLCPVGVPGELCITGDGLARGYLNRPELTAEKFVANPFRSGSRMYRTGDLARWLPDGNIEYLGRIDNQVKIRGFRIELGEIEAELLKHKDIKEAVVTARDDKDIGKYLCAYIVSDEEIPVVQIREHLGGNLPEYMIPSYFMHLDKMPLSPNGKVDRKALPEPDRDINTGRDFAAPTNEIEEKLVEIWKEILGLERIGIHDRFFELGGYSILLIKMHTKVEELYPGRVKITDLFAYPTVSQLAEFIQSTGSTQTKQLSLKALELPEEYFRLEERSNKEVNFRISLDEAITAKLKESSNAADMYDTLLSVYSYLLSQISGSDRICVQAAVDNTDAVYPLEVELGNINKFTDLAEQISSKRKNTQAEEIYSTKDVTAAEIAKGRNSIIPLLYNADFIPSNYDVLDVFDIAVEVGVTREEVNISCRFNGKRVNKAKMKEFAGLYLKLLELFLK